MTQSLSMTAKQVQIMTVIVAGNKPAGAPMWTPVDLDELIERVPYETTKDSMHFSIRALIKRGMIEKGPHENRRGRKRVTIMPTTLGKQALAGPVTTASAPVVVSAEAQEMLEIIE